MMPLRAYGLLGAALVTLAAVVGLYLWGAHNAETACRAAASEQLAAAHAAAEAGLRRAIEQAEAIARQDAELLAAHGARTQRVRAVFGTIREEARRHDTNDPQVGAVVCLDADGLRLWAAANAAELPAADAAPDPDRVAAALPADPGAGLGPGGGPAEQPPGGDAGIPPVPGAGTGLDGMGDGRKTVIPIYAVERIKRSPALGGGPR